MQHALRIGGFRYVALAALALLLAPAVRHAPRRVAVRVDCTRPGACALAEQLALDVWSEQRGPGLPLDVVVSEDDLDRLAAYQILVPDIDAAARAEHARIAAAHDADFFTDYHDYRDIIAHLATLAELAPDRVQMVPIGSSLDARTIWAIRIGHGTPMLVNATEHAREWISTAVATCIADRAVRDPALREFTDHTEPWVVPVVNPDGYQYSWSTDRYWRKNRRGGFGVDLNRNFSVAWGGDGSSSRKRAQDYRGERPFSEPESVALRDLAMRIHPRWNLDFHAYGQLLLYPWGYAATPAPDRDLFAAAGDRIASALFAQHETRYQLMQAVELYPASGTSLDWMYGEAHAFSYTIELRPRRGGGFVLPPEEIKPTCDEAVAAVLALRATSRE
jgi:zinc carboxypeptidase